MSRPRRGSGYTLVEVAVAAAVLSVLVLAVARFFRQAGRDVARTSASIRSQNDIRRAAMMIEEDFSDMLAIDVARQDSIEFIMDSYRMPGYAENAVLPTGLTRAQDPDDDGDANSLVPAADRWKVGFDLQDDDDDNNNLVDVRCRYRLVGTDLVRDFAFNEAWGDPTIVLSRVSQFNLIYFGSADRGLGANVDLGLDGRPGLDMTGEADGIITQVEIDTTTVANGGNGNQNGWLDTPQERRYITAVQIELGQDQNGDGETDFELRNLYTPPVLGLKWDL